MVSTTEDIFPIAALAGNCMLNKNGDISFVYQMMLPEVYSLSEENFDAINSELFRFFKSFNLEIGKYKKIEGRRVLRPIVRTNKGVREILKCYLSSIIFLVSAKLPACIRKKYIPDANWSPLNCT